MKKRKKKKKKVKIFVEDMQEYHTSNRVHFVVKLFKDAFDEIKDSEAKILKKMKLQTTISVTNLVCFNHERKIKKYAHVNEILEEFYQVRIVYYDLRKEFLISLITKDLEIISNKVRFVLAVISGEIEVRKVKRNVLIAKLVDKNFTPWSKILKMVSKGSHVEEILEIKNEEEKKEEDDDEQNQSSKPVMPAKEFDYLVGMPMWNLTEEKVNQLEDQKKVKEEELKKLERTLPQDLWLDDLQKFEKCLDEVEAQEEEDRSDEVEGEKGGKKKKTKKPAGKKKKNDMEEDSETPEKEANKKKKNKVEKTTTKEDEKSQKEETKSNKKIDNFFPSKDKKKEEADPLKTTLLERISKRINSQENNLDPGVIRADPNKNFHSSKRKIVIDDEIFTNEKISQLEKGAEDQAPKKTAKKKKNIIDDDPTDAASFKF